MHIKEFDKATCSALGQEIEAALQPIAERLGIEIRYKGGRYAVGQYHPKIECSVRSEDGTAETSEVSDFRRWAIAYGLQTSDLGKEFTHRGEAYKVSGLKPASKKMPILATRKDGKTFKFGAELVRKALEAKPA